MLMVTESERKNASCCRWRSKTCAPQKNASAKSIGKAKAAGEDVAALLAEVSDLGDQLTEAESGLQVVQSELRDIELGLPNLLHPDVPSGSDESANREICSWGDMPSFSFAPQDHVGLGAALGMLDFDAASRISGSRFAVMTGETGPACSARSFSFMLNLHVSDHGYRETYVPYLVQSDALQGTGQLPKFEADLFRDGRRNAVLPDSNCRGAGHQSGS